MRVGGPGGLTSSAGAAAAAAAAAAAGDWCMHTQVLQRTSPTTLPSVSLSDGITKMSEGKGQ